jgi:hypothetical protein
MTLKYQTRNSLETNLGSVEGGGEEGELINQVFMPRFSFPKFLKAGDKSRLRLYT